MVIGLTVVSTSVTGVQYDMARQSVHAGDLERAERSLGRRPGPGSGYGPLLAAARNRRSGVA